MRRRRVHQAAVPRTAPLRSRPLAITIPAARFDPVWASCAVFEAGTESVLTVDVPSNGLPAPLVLPPTTGVGLTVGVVEAGAVGVVVAGVVGVVVAGVVGVVTVLAQSVMVPSNGK